MVKNMKRRWKNIIFLLISFVFLLNAGVIAYATESDNTVCFGDAVLDISSKRIDIPIMIEHNTGLMGFRLIVSYSNSIIHPVTVKRGTSLSSGMFTDSITSANNGMFDILWSGSSDCTEDGELCIITFSFDEEITDFSFTIGLSYNKDDTFNERWQDVNLNCGTETSFYVKNDSIVEINPASIQRLLVFFKKLIEKIRSILFSKFSK